MTNRRAARSPKQRQAMRTTTGAAVPAQQPRRDGTEYWRPEDVPQERSFAPQWDADRRCWSWDGWSEDAQGPMRDVHRSWLEDDYGSE